MLCKKRRIVNFNNNSVLLNNNYDGAVNNTKVNGNIIYCLNHVNCNGAFNDKVCLYNRAVYANFNSK